MRGSLILTALAVAGLFVACYPAPGIDRPEPTPCVTACGVTFTGEDCAGFAQLEQRTVRAFGECDAGTPSNICASLGRYGWTVDLHAPLPMNDAGDRGWHPRGDDAAQLCLENAKTCDAGSAWIQGQTDCYTRPPSISLADEHWPSGVAAVELIHAATLECAGNPYPAWKANGRACVKARVIAGYRDAGNPD